MGMTGKKRKLNLLRMLLDVLRDEDNIVAPQNAWTSDLDKMIEEGPQDSSAAGRDFICLLLSSVLLVKKPAR
jgi:hypothetical protein